MEAIQNHEQIPILSKIRKLFDELNSHSIRYAHWKSNFHFDRMMSGIDDIDILIERQKSSEFESLIASLGFKRAASLADSEQLSIAHYYALNDDGSLVHIHAYYKVITGDSLLKNYHLPLENLLLDNTRTLYDIKLPTAEAEAVVFVFRLMLKQIYLIDQYFVYRDYKKVIEEYDWLTENFSREKFLELVQKYIPFVDTNLFLECFDLAPKRNAVFQRIRLGRKFRATVSSFARSSRPAAWIKTYQILLKTLYCKFFAKRAITTLASGGALIAFIGPQATGKSTLCKGMKAWLSGTFVVEVAHVGKPPSAWLTLFPNLLLPLARALFPKQRSTYKDVYAVSSEKGAPSIFHIFRMVVLAYDRRVYIERLFKMASRGALIFCDRYPSLAAGSADSAISTDQAIANESSNLKKYLMKWERRLCANIPMPSMIINLSVPVEVAVQRDLVRDKVGPKDPNYVRQRHSVSIKPLFPGVSQTSLSTTQDFSQTLNQAKEFVWSHL